MEAKKYFKNDLIKRWNVIIPLVVVLILIILSVINGLTREKYYLSEEQNEILLKFFPQEILGEINWYYGGFISLGASKIFFNSVYLNKKNHPDLFSNPLNLNNVRVLVHEAFHILQAKKMGYLRMDAEALYFQFKSFILTGSRDGAYLFSFNQSLDSLNVEQEAALVDDFYPLVYAGENESFFISCFDCELLSEEELYKFYENSLDYLYNKYLS